MRSLSVCHSATTRKRQTSAVVWNGLTVCGAAALLRTTLSGLTRRNQPTPPSGVPTRSEGKIFEAHACDHHRQTEQVFSLTALEPPRWRPRAPPFEDLSGNSCCPKKYLKHTRAITATVCLTRSSGLLRKRFDAYAA